MPDSHVHFKVGESLYLNVKVSGEISAPDDGGICSLNIGGSLYLKVRVSEGISAPDCWRMNLCI